MSNYEIMLILDPASDDKIVSEIAKSTFKSKDVKIERLERTELAYEINKSKTAIYVLVKTKATGDEINEFNRKANIAKNIWRLLSINLDTEKGLNRKAKPKKVKKGFFGSKKIKNDEIKKTEKDNKKESTSEKATSKKTSKKSDSSSKTSKATEVKKQKKKTE